MRLLLIISILLASCGPSNPNNSTKSVDFHEHKGEENTPRAKDSISLILEIDEAKCNVNVVRTMYQSLDNPRKELINLFLLSFSDECSSNVEYSEFSNETLFELITRHPALFINVLSMNDHDLKQIVQVLKNPINDTFSSKEIINIISGLPKDPIQMELISMLSKEN